MWLQFENRKLKLGFGATIEFEQLTGIKIQELGNATTFESAVKLLWVELKQNDDELTLENTIKMIDDSDYNMLDIMRIAGETIGDAFFDKDAPVVAKSEEIPNETPLSVISAKNSK